MKLNKKYLKNKRYLLFSSALAFAIICTIQLQNDGSIKVSDSILEMKIDDDAPNETADIFTNETENPGLVIEEKIAIDPIYIFSSKNELKYNTQTINVKIEPKDDCEEYCTMEKGSEFSVLGYNDFGYAKILLDNQELYVKNENLTDNKNEIFFDCEYTRYSANDIEIYDSISLENVITTVNKYDSLTVIGENDSNIKKVSVNNAIGFVKQENLIEYLPKQAYITQGDDGITDYYKNNMYDGVLSDLPDSQKTEENIVALAKLIHCEAGGQTEEGKLAVATVVVNRAYDGNMGNTIQSVIERPGQFSPVSSGAYYSSGYSDSDYNASKKVIVDGYRSFPAYILFFQSIRDGYFGQSTYCICYSDDKSHPQYFSYKQSDLNKYKN